MHSNYQNPALAEELPHVKIYDSNAHSLYQFSRITDTSRPDINPNYQNPALAEELPHVKICDSNAHSLHQFSRITDTSRPDTNPLAGKVCLQFKTYIDLPRMS
jgi:hypothetical protein